MSAYSSTEAKMLSDSDIDQAYAALYDNKDVVGYSVLAQEILDRLSNPWSFIRGVFGSTRFPLYDARGNFHQVEVAQSAVVDNTKKVAGSITFGFKGVRRGTGGSIS